MAGIRKKGDAYYCTFRFQGQRYNFTIGPVSKEVARARGVEVDETLDLLERGRLSVPDGVLLTDFVFAGGKSPPVSARSQSVSARELFDHYLETHSKGTVEESTLSTSRTHLTWFIGTVGERFRMHLLTPTHLQQHIDLRRRRGVAAVTLKKELATVRAC